FAASANAPQLPAEAGRLRALKRLDILDTEPELEFDEFAAIARSLFGTSMALISFVDDERQWFKARVRLDLDGSNRASSFCTHTIADDQPFVIPDTHLDARFVESPLVTGPPHVRFYAGAPIHEPEGHRVGALCVLDVEPREVTGAQLDAL